MRVLIGIDKGTSVIKTVVFGLDGRQLATAQRRVVVLRPHPGWHEEDPDQTWRLCAETIREALHKAECTGSNVAAIGIAGHMGGAWLVDPQGEPVRNGICWPDARAQQDLVALERTDAFKPLFAISGNGLMPGITVLLLAWLARHEPETLANTAAVLCAKDYLRLKLTGVVGTDPSDISFMPGDIDARTYSEAVFTLCNAQAWLDKRAPVLPSESIAGVVSRRAAAQTGVRAGTPVVTGLGDACASAIGLGAITPGSAFTVLGTSCLNSMVCASADRAPFGLGFTFTMAGGEHYLRILPNTSGTITMDWFLERFGGPKTPQGHWDFDQMAKRADAQPPGAQGVIFVPYVNGAGVLAPFYDPVMRGGFFGASTHTTHDHLLRAVYESLCYATRDCLAAMVRQPQRLTLTGGGAQNAFWVQMFADVCGIPVHVPNTGESGALGVALLAGVAVGTYPDLAQAVQQTTGYRATYTPRPDLSAQYDGWFDLYQQVRDLYRGFSAERAALAAATPAAATPTAASLSVKRGSA